MYGNGTFDTIDINETEYPELARFVNETRIRGPKFSNYTREKLNYFADKIYELRKDNTDNTAG